MGSVIVAHLLYGALAVIGLLDLLLVTPALRAATTVTTIGRLLSTLLVLAGLVISSSFRFFNLPPMSPPVVVGLVLIDAGLVGYALYLPATGLLELLSRFRRRKGQGSAP